MSVGQITKKGAAPAQKGAITAEDLGSKLAATLPRLGVPAFSRTVKESIGAGIATLPP